MKSKTEQKLYSNMRQMVAYIIDVDDAEVIDGYTPTFVDIAKKYHKAKKREELKIEERKEDKAKNEFLNSLARLEGVTIKKY